MEAVVAVAAAAVAAAVVAAGPFSTQLMAGELHVHVLGGVAGLPAGATAALHAFAGTYLTMQLMVHACSPDYRLTMSGSYCQQSSAALLQPSGCRPPGPPWASATSTSGTRSACTRHAWACAAARGS